MTHEPHSSEKSISLPTETPQYNPARIEQQIIDYRKANNTFQRSIDTRSEDQPYRFYDGPPFITGLPHPGSLLSSIVKDVITRYQTQKGKRIERVRGWDCHGIYIEQKVQEKYGYASNLDIEKKGVGGFIDACQTYTKDISDQRDWYVDHVGRWVDFKNAYKTMDNSYMESVLRVFKSLREKGLVYKGKRVSLYSTKLNTPISNYEVAMDNSYADISDPAVTVKFPVVQEKSEEFETTEDGFVKVVTYATKNADGEYLFVYRKDADYWCCPGGRVRVGETLDGALARIVKKEIGCEVSNSSYVGSYKKIINGMPIQMIFYTGDIVGEPALQEPEVHQELKWVGVVSTDE